MSETIRHEDKSCEWEDSVSSYVLGNLADEDRIALEKHLAGGCAKCSIELSRAAEALTKLAESSTVILPTGLRERFLMALNRERAPQQQPVDSNVIFSKSGILISRSEAIPWHATETSGIWVKALFVDVEQHSVTSIVRIDPGACYPSHRHGGPEEIFLLTGEVMVEGNLLRPGDYCHAAPTSVHGESFSNSGCTFILRASGSRSPRVSRG